MVFSSMFFVYMFLPLSLLAYILMPNIKAKNISLLISSLIFYAFSGPQYVPLLLLVTLVSYISALLIESKGDQKGLCKLFMALDVAILLGLLAYFKYTNLLIDSFHALTDTTRSLPKIILPVGISFYTFQLISYTADVYRGEVKAQRNYFHLLLYASLFHQCVAGPIVRYQTVSDEITCRKVRPKDVAEGIRRFSVGLCKKALLANGAAAILNEIIPEVEMIKQTGSLTELADLSVKLRERIAVSPVMTLWFAMILFTLQIYLDFSAYSDMAIGMGRMVGFHYDENFNYPYIADSVQGFWRRWHISLSTFFRDYVYIPLGGNRKGVARTVLNLFIVWGLTGLWHGGCWNYLLWGLFYFVFLVLERFFFKKWMDKAPVWVKPLFHIYTLLIVILGWTIFYFEDVANAFEALTAMLCLGGKDHPFLWAENTRLLFKGNFIFIIIACICSTPLYAFLRKKMLEFGKEEIGFYHAQKIFDLITILFCMILATFALVGNTYNPFLYLRF